MSYEEESPRRPKLLSPLAPLLVLAGSQIAMFIWQITNINTQTSAVRETQTQYTEAIAKREASVTQSTEIQAKLQAVLTDLLELAKTDEKAAEIVKKYGIQQTAPPAAAASPAPK